MLNNKKIFILFLFFLCLSLLSGIYLIKTDFAGNKSEQAELKFDKTPALEKKLAVNDDTATQTEPDKKTEPDIKKRSADKILPADYKPIIASSSETTATTADSGQKQVLYVGDKKYEIKTKADSTVYELMEALKKHGDLDFNGVSSSGLGFFVQEINGIKNSPGDDTYWLFYINGKSASMGISNYILKPEDIIVWKYEKPQF